MSFHYYAATIRKLTCGLPRSEEYDNIIDAIKKKYTHLDIRYNLEMVYKINGNHNVHTHLMIKSPKPIHGRMLLSVIPKGYRLYLEPCKSELAWTAYITKEDQPAVRAQIAYYHESPENSETEEYIEDSINPTHRIV